MNIVTLADTDEMEVQRLGRADVLIACGDIEETTILQAARATKAGAVLAVKGNHDTDQPFASPIVDLHRNVVTIGGLAFGGFCGCWAYKPRGHFLFDQHEVEIQLAGFPAVDVFVAHNAPAGIHDRDDGVHLGFDAFVDYIDRVQPTLFLHGHLHSNQETIRGRTRVRGVFGGVAIELASNQQGIR